jgi:quinoprotein glucose dehydrogenase
MKNQSVGRSRFIALMATASVAALTASNPGATAQPAAATQATEWKYSGSDATYTRFSPLNQITAANVSQLKPAWIYDPGTFGRSWEDTPLLINGLLYVSESGSADVVALEPETGKEIWRHKAPAGKGGDYRGIMYWGGEANMKPRLVTVWGNSMYGIDPKTGQPSSDWPATGFNVLLPPIVGTASGDNLAPGPAPGSSSGAAAAGAGGGAGGGGENGGVAEKSPPVIYKNLIIFAGASGFLPPPGRPADPHAYDLRTGKLVWTTRLIPGPSEPGADGWVDPDSVLGSGSWGLLSLDEKTGTVYVPTDSGSPDLVGVWRPGKNQWADSTVALDAETGKIKWAFQNNYHDVWDMDTMAAPVRVDVTRNGKTVPLVVQTTKQGQVWILNADTGKPVYGYKEIPVVQSKVPGEKTWPTEPFPDGLSLAQMTIDRDHLSQLSPQANADCKAVWDQKKLHNEGPYTPPAPDGWTAMVPGAIGGIDWGGISVDPDIGYGVTNVTNMPTMVQLTHGPEDARGAVKGNNGWRFSSGYVRFSDTKGRPCSGGRQGELVGINLATGKVAWRVPLGDLSDEYGPGAKKFGASDIGPSIVTRGGVVFIGAAADDKFHAFDIKTGKLLWQAKMSASSNAGPMTYIGKDGRQYVVIAAGGPGNARRRSVNENFAFHQTLVAFALPRPGDEPIDIVTPYPKRPPLPGENLGPSQ